MWTAYKSLSVNVLRRKSLYGVILARVRDVRFNRLFCRSPGDVFSSPC